MQDLGLTGVKQYHSRPGESIRVDYPSPQSIAEAEERAVQRVLWPLVEAGRQASATQQEGSQRNKHTNRTLSSCPGVLFIMLVPPKSWTQLEARVPLILGIEISLSIELHRK